jgi:hypothetical protein
MTLQGARLGSVTPAMMLGPGSGCQEIEGEKVAGYKNMVRLRTFQGFVGMIRQMKAMKIIANLPFWRSGVEEDGDREREVS